MAIEPLRLGETRQDIHSRINQIIAAVNAITEGSTQIPASAVAVSSENIEATDVAGALEELYAAINA